MAEKLVIDPVTRVEGHLRVEAEIESGVIKNAWVSSNIARGFEQIFVKKDPWDAPLVAQRVCGLCGGSHGVCGVTALDSLLGVDLPENARIMRNLLMGTDFISTHIIRFYQFIILDFIDASSVLNYTGIESTLLALKKKLEKALNKGDAYPFKPSFDADELVIKDPAMTTLFLTHYFEALEMRKKAHQVAALLGGRMPGFVGIIPGGVTHLISADDIGTIRYLLSNLVKWINSIFLPDVIALVTSPLLSYGQQGVGKGRGNFLSVGAFDLDPTGHERLFPSGAIFNGKLSELEPVDSRRITDDVKYSWYNEGSAKQEGAESRFDLNKKKAYSFVKAPRYKGKAMEVGPLARLLVKKDETLANLMKDFGIQIGVVARYVALVIECKVIAEAMVDWLDELSENTKKTKRIWDERKVPSSGRGVGLMEAPSGALSHVVEVKKSRVNRYQLITPTAWNASPRDNQNKRGPLEEALLGLPVPNPNNPLSILRVVHSFNLCMSCGAH